VCFANACDTRYGDWRAADWEPQPLPLGEAGTAAVGGQRRYLWTDAWGVLNFCTLAHRARNCGDEKGFAQAVAVAKTLVATVHLCLGNSAGKAKMRPTPDGGLSFTGTPCVGLRIGKTHAAAQSDAGMALDGQYVAQPNCPPIHLTWPEHCKRDGDVPYSVYVTMGDGEPILALLDH